MLRIERLSHAHAGRPALRDVTFSLAPGEHAVLLGCNGSGKTTLLRAAAGLLAPDGGTVRYGGVVLADGLADRAWRRRFRREVGLLTQDPDALLFNPTVGEEIAFGPRQFGLDAPEERARRWAERLGVAPLWDCSPAALSDGERKRVALAAVLVLEPRLLLLDEPFAGLDPRSTGRLVDLLRDHPAALLAATHNLGLGAELADRALVLGEDHTLLFDGPTPDVLADLPLLQRANLVHRHRHRHGELEHRHDHYHDWE